MNSVRPKHLTSHVPGDISPLISSLDVICERFLSVIWANLSRGMLLVMFFFFLTGRIMILKCICTHPMAHLMCSDPKPTVQPFIGPLNASVLYCLVEFKGENKLFKRVMKQVFHLPQSLFGLNPSQLFAWSNKLCFYFLERCIVGHWCGASFVVVYIVFIWEVNYVCFFHIYLD